MPAFNPPIGNIQIPEASVSALEALAGILLERGYEPDHRLIIVPLVGAGASASAGLPTSNTLKTALLNKYVGPDNRGRMHHALNLEAKRYFPSTSANVIDNLSLFEFCAVLSMSEYGKECLENVLNSELEEPTHRPITHEILAHLAKHKFIDHLISLNFDALLDDALREELPGRHHVIVGENDIPGPTSLLPRLLARDACYLFKPFGSALVGKYSLSPDELNQYGPQSVWNFCLNYIFLHDNTRVGIVLILIGYAAYERAFMQLVDALRTAGRHLTIFAIDIAPRLNDSLRQLNARHINLDADTALTLLTEFMRVKRGNKIWIPVARHHIISQLLNYTQLSDYARPETPRVRFELEVILQAIKSRGFFTLEALAEIDRIRIYGREAHSRLQALCGQEILTPQPWGAARDHSYEVVMQDYELKRTHAELAVFAARKAKKDPDESVDSWSVVRSGDRYRPTKQTMRLAQFLEEKFREIARAPDIEISSDSSPSTIWTFSYARTIRSMPELERRTFEVFSNIRRNRDKKIEIRLISSTAEWIFHEEGWAYREIGRDILEELRKGTVNLKMILLESAQLSPEQKDRLDIVVKTLADKDPAKKSHLITYLGWWRLNRRLTLVKTEADAKGIYFRRRLFTPIVSPVYLNGDDCKIAENIFEYYIHKSQNQALIAQP